jgi:hypothetical protein
LTSSVTTVEPEWSEQDRGWIQALLSIEHSKCPGCGGDLEETTRQDPDEGYDVEHQPCKRCQSLEIARERYHKAHQDKEGHSDVHNHVWTASLIRRGE